MDENGLFCKEVMTSEKIICKYVEDIWGDSYVEHFSTFK